MTDNQPYGVFGTGAQLAGTPGFALCDDEPSSTAGLPSLEIGRFEVREVFELDVPMLLAPKAHGPASKPCEPLNANWRLHWTSYNERVGAIRKGIVTAARAAKIPNARHLTVGLHYRPGDNRRRDADNLYPTLKAACDALARGPRRDWVGLELVPDDTPEHMTKQAPQIHPGPGPRRLWLTVEVQR